MKEALVKIQFTAMEKDKVLSALKKAVDTATTDSKDTAGYKGEVDGFVKTIQDLHDTALTDNLLAIVAAAKGKQENAQTLLKNAESITKSSVGLSDAIEGATKQASNLSKTAGNAYDKAKSLHDAITSDYSAKDILVKLDEAKKLKSSVDGASTDSQDLSKSTGKTLEELKQLTFGTIAT